LRERCHCFGQRFEWANACRAFLELLREVKLAMFR
jgi:hypothetical protein